MAITKQPELIKSDDLSATNIDVDRQVKQFVDAGGLSTRWLEFGLWYVEHKKLFFLLAVWSLSLIAAVLWSFSLYYFSYYLMVGIKQDRLNELALSEGLVTAARRPVGSLDLEKLAIKALPVGQGRYDLVGSVTNNNERLWSSFDYYFLVDGVATDRQAGFVLPQESKLILSLGQALPEAPQEIKLILERVGYHRLTNKSIPDWPSFKADHLNFVVQDKVFVPYTQTGLTEKLPISRLSFKIINQTAFNFRQARFLIALYQGDNLLSVEHYTVNDFLSKEKRSVTLTIVGNFAAVSRIDILPDINIINGAEYKAGY